MRTILLSLAFSVLIISSAFAHPAEDLMPYDLPSGYGTQACGLSSELNLADLTFTCPYPQPEDLSAIERYMVAGAHGPNQSLLPWYLEVFQLVTMQYAQTGEVPPTLTPEVLTAAGKSAEDHALFFNPITGEPARLDAVEPSAGDMYIRPLNEDEMQYFAARVLEFNNAWYKQEQVDPATGEPRQVALVGKPMYVRLYGEAGVIHTGIHFISALH